jgi:error-prone DNA polymerase
MQDDIRTTHAVRLGLREIKGLREEDGKLIVERRSSRPDKSKISVAYDSMRDVWLRTGLSPHVLERLGDADAFGSLGLARREALWAAKALGRVGDRDDDLPLFTSRSSTPARIVSQEPDVRLPPMPIGEGSHQRLPFPAPVTARAPLAIPAARPRGSGYQTK